MTDYVKYVVPRAALAPCPLWHLLMSLKLGLHIQTLPGLVGAGSVMVLLFAITWIFCLSSGSAYVDLRPHLGRFARLELRREATGPRSPTARAGPRPSSIVTHTRPAHRRSLRSNLDLRP